VFNKYEKSMDDTTRLYENIPLKIWEEVDINQTFGRILISKNPVEEDQENA
jgi:hypothetical protein